MNFQHLEYFNELAETQYMAQAAEKLGISQPTLSYAVKKLEEELGVPLFEREGRNIRLTVYGKTFKKYSEAGVQQIQEGRRLLTEMALGESGKLSIGVAEIVAHQFITDVIKEYRQTNPGYRVDFNLKRAVTSRLLEMLQAGDLDLAIVTTRPGEKIAGFDLVPVMQRKLELLLPAGHELARQRSVSLKQIESCPYLAFGEENAMAGIIADVFAKNGIHPQISSVTDDVRTLVDLVAIGEGVALLPKSKYHEAAGAIAVPVAEDTSYTISLASRGLGQETKVAQDMASFIISFCQGHGLTLA
ncbi:LysR family transcriptional regulator [Lactobacillus nasalidis]|uniref:LysR family transcriptional regulator n=1 Tax=Lactobacillus nasalidis TaxID=2797258 RepID=A0ABQ3W4Z0_9LACO|nr:LysR family transcriptional regulator [Lactobacillus nasalidis]GHV96920.1 LysR family transcriptional regulator [Lactobacillus nasalidis]GHV99864.1 LysR family transcriptional regulator [Lactobacillus nasalidis]GHW00445.1 LysR family transcriptional regulator [Lactobacillus nasalidis]